MFAKLLVIIISAGVISLALLSIRQRRLDAAHDLSLIHQRLLEHRRSLWDLELEIAERVRPDQIRLTVEQTPETWTAIPSEPAQSEIRSNGSVEPP